MMRKIRKSVNINNPDRITRIGDPFLKIRKGNVEEIRNLLQAGSINANASRWSGFTLLHRAAEIGHTELCLLLIQEGQVDVNVRSTRGWYTPLHIALANGYIETGYALIKHGANPWMQSKYNENPFDYGGKRGFRQLCEEFRDKIRREELRNRIQRHEQISDVDCIKNEAQLNKKRVEKVDEKKEKEND
jgi:ankyrin repeat protein